MDTTHDTLYECVDNTLGSAVWRTVLYSGGALGTPSSGNLTNCTNAPSPAAPVTLTISDAATNTKPTALTVAHTTSGTPVNGFGISIDYKGSNAAGTNKVFGQAIMYYNDPTNGAENSTWNVHAFISGTLTDLVLISGTQCAMRSYSIQLGYGTGIEGVLDASAVTTSRTWAFPDAAGTVMISGHAVVTDLSDLGTNVATFLQTPTSANLRAALTDETGTGAAYFVGGALGTPASGNLVSCSGYLVGNLGNLGTGVAAFLATPSSANLAAAVTDETGSGALVFGTSPTISGLTLTGNLTAGVTYNAAAALGAIMSAIHAACGGL